MKKNNFFIRLISILALTIFFISCVGKKELKKYEISDFAFGTYVKIVTYANDDKKVNEAFEKAFDEMRRIDEKFNSKNEKSLIYALNNKKVSEIELDEEGQYIFGEVKKMYELSNHKYDITVEPLMELWGFTEDKINLTNLKVPSYKDIEFAKTKIDFSKVKIENNKMSYDSSIKGIDTGSFIKGYALEKAKQVMIKEGFKNTFITAISSLETSGTKPDNKKWKIGLENPENTNEILGVVSLSGENMGVSGDYQTFVEIDGKIYHHILDKDTGFPVADKKMVAVITDDGLKADLYSTTFFLMPIDKVISYVESQKNLEVLIVNSNMEIIKSKGFNLEKLQK